MTIYHWISPIVGFFHPWIFWEFLRELFTVCEFMHIQIIHTFLVTGLRIFTVGICRPIY